MKSRAKLTLKIYWTHVKKYRALGLGLVLSVIFASAISVVSPLFFKRFFDILTGASVADARPALLKVLIIITGLELAGWVLWRLGGFLTANLQPKVMADLNNFCFAYLHKHSFTFFNNNFVGSLVKRVNWFTRSFESIGDKIVWNLLQLTVNSLIILAVLSFRNLYLGVIVVVWMAIFLTVNYVLSKYKLKFDIKRSEAETKTTGHLADTITNHANVKLFGGYEREKVSFGRSNDEVRRLRTFTWNLDNGFEAIQTLLMIGLEIGIFYYAIGLWQRNILTTGDFVLIQSYLLTLFMRVWDFGRIIRHLYEDLANAEDMTAVLDTPHEIQDIHNAKQLAVSEGAINFIGVSFFYHQTRQVIKDFYLQVQPRQKLALAGPSGSGKTTIVKLLMRVHDVTQGKILIDSQNVAEVTQQSLWRNVSMVPQEPMLFHRSLMENIRYGRPEATDAEVLEAARLAHCHEFISSFPDGYSTFVGERGVKLSGGERQRVAIARAILRDTPILVLDEATSSLDSESECLIQDALQNLMQGKTVIVIAHRLSTIMKMDRIVILDRGKIVEDGTHAELLTAERGIYKKLWELQAGGFIQSS